MADLPGHIRIRIYIKLIYAGEILRLKWFLLLANAGALAHANNLSSPFILCYLDGARVCMYVTYANKLRTHRVYMGTYVRSLLAIINISNMFIVLFYIPFKRMSANAINKSMS